MTQPTYDLYRLNEHVLMLKNEDFYQFVCQVAGELEASVLKVQGIQNARSFIRSTDVFDVFKLDCDELNEIKKDAFWQCNNGNYVVKQGIALNLKILKEVLNDEHDKFIKKINRQRKSSFSMLNSSIVSTANEINLIDNRSSSNTSTSIQNFDSSNTSSTEMIGIPIESIRVSPVSVNHFDIINNAIEKYSKKYFESIVLKYNEHYRLSMVKQDERMKVILHCQCGTQVSSYQRDGSSSFVLSNYYAHLSQSTCSMMRKMLKQNQIININASYLSAKAQNQSSTLQFNDETENSNEMFTDTTQSSSIVSNDHGVAMKTNTNKRKSIETSSSSKRQTISKKRRKKSN